MLLASSQPTPAGDNTDALLNEHRRLQRQAVLTVLGSQTSLSQRRRINGFSNVSPAPARKSDFLKKRGQPLISWQKLFGGHKKIVSPLGRNHSATLIPPAAQIVLPHQIKRRWPVIIFATIILLIGLGWLSIYKFGAHGPMVRLAASILPLPAGRVNHQTILLNDVLQRLELNNYLTKVVRAKTNSKLAADTRSVFGELVDKELIHQELAARQQPVNQAVINNEYDKMRRSLKTAAEFTNWVKKTYSVDLNLFNKVVLGPWLERQRLAIILISNQVNYPKPWEEAKKTSLSRGTTNLEDLGWVSAADLPDGLPEIVANLIPGIRTQPFVVSDGLMVLLVTEGLKNENNVPNWHLWQRLIPVSAINDFLTAARSQADIKYYLP